MWGAGIQCKTNDTIASSHEVSVPRHRLSTYGRRAFAVAGPTVWNSLPEDMRDPDVSENNYGQSLKTFLFLQYYCVQRVRVFFTRMRYINFHLTLTLTLTNVIGLSIRWSERLSVCQSVSLLTLTAHFLQQNELHRPLWNYGWRRMHDRSRLTSYLTNIHYVVTLWCLEVWRGL